MLSEIQIKKIVLNLIPNDKDSKYILNNVDDQNNVLQYLTDNGKMLFEDDYCGENHYQSLFRINDNYIVVDNWKSKMRIKKT